MALQSSSRFNSSKNIASSSIPSRKKETTPPIITNDGGETDICMYITYSYSCFV